MTQRRSLRTTRVVREEEDVCEKRRSTGIIFSPGRAQHLEIQGCYCPIHCTGKNKLGCTNEVPIFDQEYCVALKTRPGLLGEERYLTAKTFIPAGALMTAMGGVTVQEKTQPKAFAAFTLLHKQQHDMMRGGKFQYSVQVGSNGLRGSTAWLIPPNDFDLLRSLLKRQHGHLKNATADSLVSPGLGQYAQHTHCPTHVNAHLFPIYILHETEEPETRQRRGRQQGDDEWMELKTVAIRADRDIQSGEEILIHYVGSGRSGDFRKVFSCVCCVCTGKCSLASRARDSVL